jgi:DNA-binding GntR family transcriptional regulator
MPPARKPKTFLGRFVTSDYQPTALHGHVYAELRRALLDGVFEPGETLSLRSIADALGTSPMPVREAVGRLVAEGALEITGSRTIAIPLLAREQFEELSELRIELEGAITERAVRRNRSDLVGALQAIEESTVVARKSNLKERLALNRRFHFTLYAAAGCDLRLRIIEILWLQSASFTHMSLAKASHQTAGVNHRKLIAAVKANDAIAARAAIEADLMETYQHLLSIGTFREQRSFVASNSPQESTASASTLAISALSHRLPPQRDTSL